MHQSGAVLETLVSILCFACSFFLSLICLFPSSHPLRSNSSLQFCFTLFIPAAIHTHTHWQEDHLTHSLQTTQGSTRLCFTSFHSKVSMLTKDSGGDCTKIKWVLQPIGSHWESLFVTWSLDIHYLIGCKTPDYIKSSNQTTPSSHSFYSQSLMPW